MTPTKSELLAELKGKLNRFKFLRMGVDEKVLTDWLSSAIDRLVESVPCKKMKLNDEAYGDEIAYAGGWGDHISEVEWWKRGVLK